MQMTDWEVGRAGDIKWGAVLGFGSFGQVFRVQLDDFTLAAKCVDPSKLQRGPSAGTSENIFEREFRALVQVNHPNIVCLYGVVKDPSGQFCLLMELADRGSLRQLLDETPAAIVGDLNAQLALAYGIASGLAYLHDEKNLMHHDIKAANVLLFSTKDDQLVAKLGDFGLATGVSSASTLNCTVATNIDPRAGTSMYRAPETYGYNETARYDKRSEVYSYAMVLYQLLTGAKPWHLDDMAIMGSVLSRKRPEIPAGIKPDLQLVRLMKQCWVPETSATSKKRPTFATIVTILQKQMSHQCLEMPTLASIDRSRLDSIVEQISAVHQQVSELRTDVLTAIAKCEDSVVHEVKAGNVQLARKLAELQGSTLAPLASVTRQAAEAATNPSVPLNVVKEAVRDALELAREQSAAANEILVTKMISKVAELVPPPDADNRQEVVPMLEELAKRMSQMNEKMNCIDESIISMQEAMGQQLRQLESAMGNLLAGENEVRIRYMMLVPQAPPDGGWLVKRAASRAWRKLSFTEPMVLIPFYIDEHGRGPMPAPVKREHLNGQQGFVIKQPKKFVKEHARLIKISLALIKVGLKVGAATAGINLPVDAIGDINDILGQWILDTLQESLMEGLMEGELPGQEKIDALLKMPEERVPEALTEAMASADVQKLTKDTYASLKVCRRSLCPPLYHIASGHMSCRALTPYSTLLAH